MDNTTQHANAFGEYEQSVLRTLAELMIPPVGEVPGASDERILAVVLARLEPSAALVRRAVTALDAQARSEWASDFLALEEARQRAILERHLDREFRDEFQMQVVTSYYEDDRVLISIGLRAGPAFPEGYQMEETDWSLLDPVRRRKPFYRGVSARNKGDSD